MADYPSTLPMPDAGSYSAIVDQGLIRTSFPVTAPNQVKNYNAPRVDINMTFSMTNADYETWLAWMMANGYDWFNMPVVSPRTPTDITSIQLVRLSSPVQVTKKGDNWLSATVAAELIPSS